MEGGARDDPSLFVPYQRALKGKEGKLNRFRLPQISWCFAEGGFCEERDGRLGGANRPRILH